MKNTLKISAILLLVAGMTFSAKAQEADPVTETATATATIVTPLTLTNAGNMNFGNITATTAGGTVVLAPGGGRTESGVQLPSTTGTVSAASFEVTGEANYAYTVTLPVTHEITKEGSTEVMALSDFTTSLGETNSGSLVAGAGSFTVGATLTLLANQVSGTYTNASGFTVSVVYN
ncbi:DUF4402 domain-containing protein [Algoriphagus boritolerans]|uniref:DUF4402 domain-containing protein n=1 Tax=Algoriphagus boritolerans DSM 17298 = JCM 18970 TaxID=1120964 RepID=A0A1H6AN18_9BACT|nr:DUF4402 domain-containing protein [Algoriphagus boritolerans]SEG49802.1 protein of unknown function [Algoriphagus boritolerans DSM 17298 = JCM 18970]